MKFIFTQINNVVQRVLQVIRQNRNLVENFSYLAGMQFVVLLLPLVTYPIIIRVLGSDLWGEVLLAQVLVSYFIIFINYGFDITAVKDIALHIDDKDKVSSIVSSVMTIKTVMFLLSFLVLCLLVNIIPFFANDKPLYYYSFAVCIGEWLLPLWYFQGVQKMQHVTIVTLISKIVFFFLIIFLIKEKSDYLLIPLFNGIGALIGGVYGLWHMFSYDGVKLKRPTILQLQTDLVTSFPVFTTKAINPFKNKINMFLIGTSIGTAEVAVYDLGTRFIMLFNALFDVVNRAVFPSQAKSWKILFVRKLIKYQVFFIIIAVALLQLILPQLVDFLGNGELNQSLIPIRLLLIVPLFSVVSMSVSINCMLVQGRNKPVMRSVFFTVVFNLCMLGLLFLTGHQSKITSFCIIAIATQFFEMLYRFIYSKKNEII